jgi:alkylation response protein AidB-like acyl-CoA dehydrogenase
VDPGLTQRQDDLRRTAKSFALKWLAPNALELDEREAIPLALLHEAGVHDWGAMLVPPELGGAGFGRLDAVLAFEALAYGDPAVATFLSVHNMATWIICAFANTDVSALLSRLASFETIASLCLTEPQAGSDAAAIKTTAKRVGKQIVLTGTKAFITGGGSAGVYVVAARSGGPGPKGISLYLVPGDACGISFGPPERKMGWRAQPTSRVMFEDVRVPQGALIGDVGGGFSIAMQALDGGRLNIAACSLGGGQAATDMAAKYMRAREAFGKPLAEFQGLQFKLADMEMRLQAARALTYVAAQKLDARAADASKYCAMAKCVASEAAVRTANDSLQIHGGYGYLRDAGLEKLVRDLRAHPIVEGTNEIMRLIVSRALLADVAMDSAPARSG